MLDDTVSFAFCRATLKTLTLPFVSGAFVWDRLCLAAGFAGGALAFHAHG